MIKVLRWALMAVASASILFVIYYQMNLWIAIVALLYLVREVWA